MINPYLILFITFTILVMSIYQSLIRQKVSSMNYFHCVSFVGPKNEVVQNIPNETDCF